MDTYTVKVEAEEAVEAILALKYGGRYHSATFDMLTLSGRIGYMHARHGTLYLSVKTGGWGEWEEVELGVYADDIYLTVTDPERGDIMEFKFSSQEDNWTFRFTFYRGHSQGLAEKVLGDTIQDFVYSR